MLCKRASQYTVVRSSRQQLAVVANSSNCRRFSSRCVCKAGLRAEDSDDLLLSIGCPVPTEQQPMNEVSMTSVSPRVPVSFAGLFACCVLDSLTATTNWHDWRDGAEAGRQWSFWQLQSLAEMPEPQTSCSNNMHFLPSGVEQHCRGRRTVVQPHSIHH